MTPAQIRRERGRHWRALRTRGGETPAYMKGEPQATDAEIEAAKAALRSPR